MTGNLAAAFPGQQLDRVAGAERGPVAGIEGSGKIVTGDLVKRPGGDCRVTRKREAEAYGLLRAVRRVGISEPGAEP